MRTDHDVASDRFESTIGDVFVLGQDEYILQLLQGVSLSALAHHCQQHPSGQRRKGNVRLTLSQFLVSIKKNNVKKWANNSFSVKYECHYLYSMTFGDHKSESSTVLIYFYFASIFFPSGWKKPRPLFASVQPSEKINNYYIAVRASSFVLTADLFSPSFVSYGY